jgi:hypothetical protein
VKFLVIWKIELSLLSPHVASAVARMQAYAKPLERSGRIASPAPRAPPPARSAGPCSVSA